MEFHHIGIACRNIREEIASISKIHRIISISPIVFDKEQKAELCMVQIAEGVNLELISGEQVENLIKKRITYYHICFQTDDIDTEIERLQNSGALLVSEPNPAILFEDRKVAFLQASYGLIELVQSKK
jgi:methylmalonyl-CoA/ethylmalonyl-CoA epimerase